MRTSQRILDDTTGSLRDSTLDLNDYIANSVTFEYNTGEYIYIASEWPFSYRYFDVTTANTETSSIEIQYWDSNEWRDTVDVLDETSSGGATLAQSGYVFWGFDREYAWTLQDESKEVTGLSSTNIYQMYWSRIKFTANLTTTTALNYVGMKFCEDADIFAQYPDLNQSRLLRTFKTGKTDWDEQVFAASNAIVRELKRRGIIFSRSQVLEPDIFMDACIHKTAEIIYNAMGPAYLEQKENAVKLFNQAMNLKGYIVDLNADGEVDRSEKFNVVGSFHR